MPELPEVETMRRDLAQVMGSRPVQSVRLEDRRLVVGEPEALLKGLPGRRVREYGRWGKVLQLTFDDGGILMLHPRMTGRLVALAPGQPLPRHARLSWELAGGEQIVFDDPRRFARAEYHPADSAAPWQLTRHLGPDALTCEAPGLQAALRRRRGPLKAVLLDQSLLAGVGNIYASEILFRCGLHPITIAGTLHPTEIEQLAVEIRTVLTAGIAHRGTTISDYRTVGGETGGYQHHLQVYGRGGEPCLRPACGGTIERTVIAGRSTYHCPRCQRTGRSRRYQAPARTSL